MKNKIKHITAAIALTLGLSNMANAQVTSQKIGTNPTTIAPSAVLDIESTNKGVLFPRVNLTSTTDAVTIASPAEGLTIYNTATAGTAPNNVSPGYYYWNGTKWTKVATDSESSKWTYDATNSRINLTNLANGTTTRTGATNFAVTDGNVLQIGDMSGIAGSSIPERSIITRKAGNNTITNISDGGIYSSVGNEIYGGTVPGSAAYFTMIKHRGSLASPQAVQNNDLIGVLDFRGGNGAGWLNGARLATIVDGTVTSSSVPLAFSFQTMADGTSILTEKMKISSNGNVGIGTTAPANKLQITQGTAGNSGLRFTNLTSASTATTTSNKVLGLNSTGDVILTNVPGTQNIVEFSVNANPNITGTTFNPATPIDQSVVYQSAIDNSLWTYNGSTYVTYTPPSSTAWNLAGTTNDAGGTKVSSISRSGNVGVGISSPSAKFHANTPSGNNNVARFTTEGTGTNWATIGLGNATGVWTSIASGDNKFQIRNYSNNTAILHADLISGNVGIGTTNPSRFLDVINSSSTYNGIIEAEGPVSNTFTRAMAIRMRRGTSAAPLAIQANDISALGFAGYDGSAFSSSSAGIAGIATENWTNINKGMALTFNTTINGSNSITEKMRVDHNGNVGIGTTAPTSRLEVNGSATNRVSHDAVSSTTIDFSQSNLARTIVNLSSNPTFTLNGIKDGGTYTLRVTSSATGTAFFSAPGLTSTTFSSPNQGLAAAGDTLYTFMVIGNKVFFYMTTGL